MVCDVAAGWSDTLSLVRVTNPVGNSASPLLVRSGTGAASQIMFLSDRDVRSEVSSPWGSRAPNPYFKEESRVFVMDLKEVVWGEGGVSEEDEEDEEDGRFDMEKVVPRRAYAVAQVRERKRESRAQERVESARESRESRAQERVESARESLENRSRTRSGDEGAN